ncbi:MAG: hypothetical protein ACM3NI_04635 [Bacteroidota bacterium]
MTTYDPSKYKHKPSPKHTLEEVLKSLQDLIRNDLLDAKSAAAKSESVPVAGDAAGGSDRASLTLEKSPSEPAVPAREDFAPTTPESGPVNLNAVVRSLKDLIHNELDTGEASAPATAAEPESIEAPPPFGARHAPADADEPAPEEYTPEAFAPLDEELTLDETAAAIAATPPATALPELPGDIEQELIVEPEPEPAPAPSVKTENTSTENKSAVATQQELPFDVPPAPVVEARLPPREPAPVSAPPSNSEPAAAAEAVTPESANLAPTPALPAEPDTALPTIEVEEDFGAAAYFETAPESTTTIAPEIQNGAAGTGKIAATPEPAPSDTLLPQTKTTLELATEPSAENPLIMPSVDFATVDLPPPRAEVSAPPAGDTPLPDSEPPAPITAAPAAAPPAAEAKDGLDAEPVKLKPQDATTPSADVAARPEETTEPPPPAAANPPPFNLDDIPVLKEVVAPPAGSSLLTEPPAARTPPPRPSPDRARDLVVRAVAKLNVEMRRTGGIGLDTKTILRLQQLIREELEKDGEK